MKNINKLLIEWIRVSDIRNIVFLGCTYFLVYCITWHYQQNVVCLDPYWPLKKYITNVLLEQLINYFISQ